MEFAYAHPGEAAKPKSPRRSTISAVRNSARGSRHGELLAFREKAYAALLRAARHADPEVVRRAGELLPSCAKPFR